MLYRIEVSCNSIKKKKDRRKMLLANLDSLNSLANVDDPEIKVRKL